MSRAAVGGRLIFTTADCRKTCETLLGRGVESGSAQGRAESGT
ncbi:hypothetical protein [Streptomyces sp. NPDC051162]